MDELLKRIRDEQAEIKRIRDARNKNCEFCGKDLSNEDMILVKENKVSCTEHKKLGEDGWKLDIIF